MKILIDISKNDYWLACNHPEALIGVYAQAIKNGTPLPKGHGNLVDYEELKNKAREYGAYVEATLSHIKPKTIIEADKEGETDG